jgi:CubicO group peptidase (beta-lactamase class C family)/D-alanyl-D-alanine dipeptidase
MKTQAENVRMKNRTKPDIFETRSSPAGFTLSRFGYALTPAIVLALWIAPAFAQNATAPQRYAAAVEALDHFIAREVADKRLPALSIALVDDQTIVWAKGYGFNDTQKKVPATAETIYRIGSVSKLYTDIAIMQLVERGALDLDAPVTKYLRDFKPINPFNTPITLRQLMAHRSGLVREPPVGHYFDPTNPSLAKTVESLNKTELVYEPEKKIKYSNAAIATVGYALEKTQGEPFAKYLQKRVLDPLGLKRSSFEQDPVLMKDLAAATMWTYHGREFDAPTFPLGMAPAGCMYSTVTDQARFLRVLFAGGSGPGGQVLKPETLEQMWTPQFAPKDAKDGFGIGFMLSELDGRKRIGHGGAIYGFSFELAGLPGDKLGVAVCAARDVSNSVTTRIADESLRHLLAVRQGKSLPAIEEPKPLPPDLATKLAGRYSDGAKGVDLIERTGKLFALPVRGGFRMETRLLGDTLVTDDALDVGHKLPIKDGKLTLNDQTYSRTIPTKPEPAPAQWTGLIGEYGWDHNTLYILEKDGKLHALIEWFFLYPLKELSENVFAFPTDFGLYHGEKLTFSRDKNGKATQVLAGPVLFERRKLDGEDGSTFRIQPIRPLADLCKEALAVQPPKEAGEFRKSDLVDVTSLDDSIKLDIRYATANNFLSTPFYTSARAFMQRPAAEAVTRVHKKLADQGYGLLIHDGYRPWYVTKMFWEATPEKNRIFVADPSKGSRHNRGMAVDLTLFDKKTGKPIEMVGGYDEMSDRSYPDYMGGTSLQRWHRDLLRRAMEAEGFTVYEAEWWHFDFKGWQQHGIQNLRFEEIGKP